MLEIKNNVMEMKNTSDWHINTTAEQRIYAPEDMSIEAPKTEK